MAFRRDAKAGGRPSQQEAERRLKRLLDIARQHFLAAGYRETSLDNIAREAAIAKKTLYRHFGSKAGLFTAIHEALRETWIAELRKVVLESEQPQVVLQAVALHTLDVGTRAEMISFHRLVVAEALRFPEIVRGNFENGAPRGMEPLADYLRKAVARNVLVLDDIPLATEQFTHLVLGGIRTRLLLGAARRPNLPERRRIAEQAVRIFLAGCMKRSISIP